jgi:hypothetical protein
MNDGLLSRRGLLQGVGGSLAAVMFRRRVAVAAEAPSPVMTRLSSYMSEARNRALPNDVLEKTALETILKRQPLDAGQVREIIVRMDPRTSVVNNREMPDVNIQHMLALMLVDKTVTFRSAHDKTRMQDPAVLRHRAKVRLDPPAGQPLLVVVLNDGTRIN